MQRPKQQALAFLLGAVLVGGVLGFSADRVFRREDSSLTARRKAMYDDLGLSAPQRRTLDSLLDNRNCQIDALLKPVQPSLDSVKAVTRTRVDRVLNADQRAKLDVRRREDDSRHDAERKRMQVCRH